VERHYHIPEPVADMMARLSLPVPECGCHAWLGKFGTGGYAYASYRLGKRRLTRKAATVAYELKNGQVPEGLELDHLCRSVWCVNADHLQAVTHSENLRRRLPFARYKGGVCKQGHALPPLAARNKNGSCPICYKLYQRAYKERIRCDGAK